MARSLFSSLSVPGPPYPNLHCVPNVGHWTVEITGGPNINMRVVIREADAGAPPSRALSDATVAVAIRTIPDVVAAPPGLFAYQPPAAWRAHFR